MQDILGSVRRSLVFRSSLAGDDGTSGGGLSGFVGKINSSIRSSRIGLFTKPPPGLPAPRKEEASSIRWRKGELIGCGAFGRVYMGMNLDSGELLAIKQVLIAPTSASKEKTHVSWGWNSILETIWCEVPVLCFPLLTDHVTNSKLVVDDWEIGINLCEDKSDFGRDEVGRNINRLMCGVSKEKIGRVKMSLEGAVRNSGSSSEMNLGLFIDGLLSKVGLSNGKASISI